MASLRRQRQAQAVVGVRLQDLGKRAYAATLLSGLSPVKQHVGSFTCGSLHALAVADVNGDGKPDIIANEQEELLLAGRENLHWIVWENLGGLKFREHVILDANLGGHEVEVSDVDRNRNIPSAFGL